jgi:hypothetical protein
MDLWLHLQGVLETLTQKTTTLIFIAVKITNLIYAVDNILGKYINILYRKAENFCQKLTRNLCRNKTAEKREAIFSLYS